MSTLVGCKITGWQEVKLYMAPTGSLYHVLFKATLNK